jgi:hypothetical protein
MARKSDKLAEFAVVKYFESVRPEFEKQGLEISATFTEFRVVDLRNGSTIFTCDTVQGLDGFIRGVASVKNGKV